MNGITTEELVWYVVAMGCAGAFVAYVIGLLLRRRK
jgi:hypothetical protein